MTVIAFPNTRKQTSLEMAQVLQQDLPSGHSHPLAVSSAQDGADNMASTLRDRLLAVLLFLVIGGSCAYGFTRIVPLVIAHGQIAAPTPDGAAAH